ncbi:TPA: hypothetical protein ACF3I9_004456 [Klebsiella aerogenes]
MSVDANDVIAGFTVIMAIGTGFCAWYARGALKKASAANALATEAQTTAKDANSLADSANQIADKAFKNGQGDSEILIHTSISEALRRQDDALIKYIEAKEKYNNDEEHFAVLAYKLFCESAIQGHLNAFDIACQRYLDGKLDQARFRKTYRNRIAELFDDKKQYKAFLSDGSSTKYHALHEVQRQFNNSESGQAF